MSKPERIAVVGDLHANTRWSSFILPEIAARLSGESVKLAVQVGDFGFWPGAAGGLYYLYSVAEWLERLNMTFMFLDGNHEDHPALASYRGDWNVPQDSRSVAVAGPRVRWLPRGSRWLWHSREWLALGGAVSVDKDLLTEGEDWFPEEAITPGQAASVSQVGQADVMLTHDCPAGVTLTLPPPPREWLPQIPAAEAHRELLQNVVNVVQPSYLIHGHYHMAYSKPVQMNHGVVKVTGLACDGMDNNWAILNVRTMEWETT